MQACFNRNYELFTFVNFYSLSHPRSTIEWFVNPVCTALTEDLLPSFKEHWTSKLKISGSFRAHKCRITSDCEKTINNLQFITGDKNKRFSFLSSIILDFNYDRIHTGQQPKTAGVILFQWVSRVTNIRKTKIA